jgi:hypothetical protein
MNGSIPAAWMRQQLLPIFLRVSVLVPALQALHAAPPKESPQPTFLVHPVSAVIERGKEGDVIVEVVPAYGGDVDFEVSRYPKFGALQKAAKTASSQIFHYFSNPKFTSEEDAFEFRVKAPAHAWNTYTAKLVIVNPPGRIEVSPAKLDFENVPIGTIAEKGLLLSNSFGAPVSGTLLLPAPWKFSGKGSFSLREGESQSIIVQFAPTETSEYTSELAISPEIAQFPMILLSGTGVAPFLLTSTSSVVTSENPVARYAVTNTATSPMTIAWSGDEKLSFSPPSVIPPKGTGEMWLSIAHLEIPIEGVLTLHPVLEAGSFSQQVELVAHGPRGAISMEALQESELPSTRMGQPLLLEGILHNTSSNTRTIELFLPDHPGAKPVPGALLKTMTLGARQSVPFSIPWTPLVVGISTPSVHAIEAGNDLCSASWKFSVVLPQEIKHSSEAPKQAPAVSIPEPSQSEIRSTPSAYLASEKQKQMIVSLLPPRFEDGIFMRLLVLRWQFFGSEQTGFILQKRHVGNTFSDRAEVDPDEWDQVPLGKQPEKMDKPGLWELKLPLPFPGIHEYRVLPNQPGEKILSSLKLEITWMMYSWPMLRLILWIAFIVIILKIIRNRISR